MLSSVFRAALQTTRSFPRPNETHVCRCRTRSRLRSARSLRRHGQIRRLSKQLILSKHTSLIDSRARKAVEDVFDSVVRARLGDVLQQYALRERHFEAIVRSKELEVLLARARAEEQHAVHESERARAAEAEALNATLRSQLEDTQSSQARLMDKLIACCKEVCVCSKYASVALMQHSQVGSGRSVCSLFYARNWRREVPRCLQMQLVRKVADATVAFRHVS